MKGKGISPVARVIVAALMVLCSGMSFLVAFIKALQGQGYTALALIITCMVCIFLSVFAIVHGMPHDADD